MTAIVSKPPGEIVSPLLTEKAAPQPFKELALNINKMILDLLKDCQKLSFELQEVEAKSQRLTRNQVEDANNLKNRYTQIQALCTLTGTVALSPYSDGVKTGVSKVGDAAAYLTKAEGDRAEASCRVSEMDSSSISDIERALKSWIEKLSNLAQSILQRQ